MFESWLNGQRIEQNLNAFLHLKEQGGLLWYSLAKEMYATQDFYE